MAAYTNSCTCFKSELGDILGGSALGLMRLHAIARAGQQLIGKESGENSLLAGGNRLQGGSGFGLWLLRQHQEDGGAFFDGALEPEPVGGGQASQMFGIDMAKVEGDNAEAAGMQQQVRGADGVVELMTGTHPKERVEIHAGLRGGMGIERFSGVDDGAELAAARCGREKSMQEAGPAGGSRTGDFSETAPGTAAEKLVKRGDTGGQRVELMRDAPPTEERSEVVRESGHFAFCSPL